MAKRHAHVWRWTVGSNPAYYECKICGRTKFYDLMTRRQKDSIIFEGTNEIVRRVAHGKVRKGKFIPARAIDWSSSFKKKLRRF